ncbi:ribonuclease III [Leptolyngbya sp. 'hensonii']|uniref:ribonuclease III n=1 Tax=Leptolyngbya sp. 'hensonii' TaxID=1922337 RepID=UPI00094FC5E9|nr:ribonuclease III [Leptolyngbya sp. 'hensonii']OLP17201.1 ribonuclease III [Leptolyngbya sp. 'hensonii']
MSRLSDLTRQAQLQSLLQRLEVSEHHPVNWSLLDRALTHPSLATKDNYEQLEFVGDAVVRLAVAEFLYQHYPQSAVGEFAAIRSVLVSDRILAQIADHYGLEAYLLIGNSAANDQAGRESRLAEAMEALLGALYLSTHSLELVLPWLSRDLDQLARKVLLDPARQNYKAALQEWTQGRYKVLPEYRVQELDRTPDSPQRFTAEVWLGEQSLGQGQGRSIKAAEQAAAQAAFLALQAQNLA